MIQWIYLNWVIYACDVYILIIISLLLLYIYIYLSPSERVQQKLMSTLHIIYIYIYRMHIMSKVCACVFRCVCGYDQLNFFRYWTESEEDRGTLELTRTTWKWFDRLPKASGWLTPTISAGQLFNVHLQIHQLHFAGRFLHDLVHHLCWLTGHGTSEIRIGNIWK